nr:LpxD N-terminal domain-containing protein [Spirulina subsalsa]
MQFQELITQLGLDPNQTSLAQRPDLNPEIQAICSVYEATPDSLSYVEGVKYAQWVEKTAANSLILPPDATLQEGATQRGIAWLATSEPRLYFARAIALFYQPYRP